MDMLSAMVARLWWGGPPDEKHPLSGMSRRDVYLVQRSWARASADAEGNGLEIFLRIFRAEPSSRSLFPAPAVARLSDAQTGASAAFRAHALTVMAALDTAVRHLAQPHLLVPMMTRLGHSHRRKSLRQKHFWIFRDVLVELLRGAGEGEAAVGAWGRLLTIMYTHIFSVLTD